MLHAWSMRAGSRALWLAAALACARDSQREDTNRSTGEVSGDSSVSGTANGANVSFDAIQIAALSDSAVALLLRDSLAALGWNTYIRRAAPDGKAVWRIRIAHGGDAALARAIAFALRDSGGFVPRVVRDTAERTRLMPGIVGPVRVNAGSHGMFARVRWVFSPDRTTMLVVEDPASVENEPVPNGFLLASDSSGRRFRMDSVWDVAPSPDWKHLAVGRGYVVGAGERDSLSTAQWETLAKRANMPVRDVRAGAFPASGMAVMVGFAQPGVVHLDDNTRPTLFPVAAGWRVAWSVDGSKIAAGAKPGPQIGDDSPATRWIALDPANGVPAGEIPAGGRLATVRWINGPTIDISVRLDTGQRVLLPYDGGRIESFGGWIRKNGRIIAPGVALATTRAGHHVAAISPNPAAREYDAKEMLVVYTIR
ncbi:MAG: SPOR domain-containing protein [Gemmatimonadaceae bacterium]